MTVIRPNSVSGITSITAQANEINFFRSNGALAGLQLNGVNFNTTTGVSTFNNLDVGGVLTYQDVTNVDSLGIGTFRTGVNVSGGQLDVGSNIKLGNAGVITATSFVGSGANLTGITQVGGSTGVDFNDNVKARFGTGNDLEIYHNGVSNILGTSNGNIELVAGSEYMAKFIPNGEVQLYNNNTRRLRVTSGGLSIQATDAGGSEHFGRFYFKQESGTVRGLFDPAAQKFSVYDNSQFTVGNDRDAVFHHDGSNTYLLNNTGNFLIRNDGTSTSEEILIQAKGGENSIRAIANGAVELYHDNVKRFETSSSGVTLSGDLFGGDNIVIRLGSHTTAGNIQLYHNSSNSYFDNNATGHIYIRNNVNTDFGGNIYIQPKSGESSITAIHDGAVELYHNNIKQLATHTDAIYIQTNADQGRIRLADTSGNIAYQITGQDVASSGESGGRLVIQDANGGIFLDARTSGGNCFVYNSLLLTGNGTLDNLKLALGASSDFTLYHDGTNNHIQGTGNHGIIFSTNNTNRAFFRSNGNFVPWANNSYDIGESGLRWRNIYTNDLNLSNEGGKNDVDGTWGNYTIQEGESDLFLINKRNGKKYKFNLTEVS